MCNERFTLERRVHFYTVYKASCFRMNKLQHFENCIIREIWYRIFYLQWLSCKLLNFQQCFCKGKKNLLEVFVIDVFEVGLRTHLFPLRTIILIPTMASNYPPLNCHAKSVF